MGSTQFNNFLGAITGIGPRLGMMEEYRLKNAALRSGLWSSPEFRSSILGDPGMKQYGVGTDFTTMPRGTGTLEGYPQLDPTDQPLLSQMTQVPRFMPKPVDTLEQAQRRLANARAGSERAAAAYYDALSGTDTRGAPPGMTLEGESQTFGPKGVTRQRQYRANPPQQPLISPDAGQPTQPDPTRQPAPRTLPSGARRARANKPWAFTDPATGQTIQGRFGPDGMTAVGSDGTNYLFDEQTGILNEVPRQQLRQPDAKQPEAQKTLPPVVRPEQKPLPAPDQPLIPLDEQPGAVQAAPPTTTPTTTSTTRTLPSTTVPTTTAPPTTSTTQPPAASPALDADEQLLGFPSPAFAEPGAGAGAALGRALAPPASTALAIAPPPPVLQGSASPAFPIEPAMPDQPSMVTKPGETLGGVEQPEPTAPPPPAKATPQVAGDDTYARQILDAAAHDPDLRRYLQQNQVTLQQAVNDPKHSVYIAGRVNDFLRQMEVDKAGKIARAQQEGKVGAGEKGQIKRIDTVLQALDMTLAPVPGDNPNQIRPIDMGPDTGSFGSEWGQSVMQGTEDWPGLFRSPLRLLTPGGAGIPGAPNGLATWQQIANRGGVAGQAATIMMQLAAGSAPLLVKAFGDTGQLSQQEQVTARERMFPSLNDGYEMRLTKVLNLKRLLQQMRAALAAGTPMDAIHDMAIDGINSAPGYGNAPPLPRSAPTRRLGTQGAGQEREEVLDVFETFGGQ